MKKYHRLTRVERYQMDALLKSGQSFRQIGKALKRAPSSLSRECRRGGGGTAYSPLGAHARAIRLRMNKRAKQKKIQGELREWIEARIREDWSPEQVVGRLRRLKPRSPSPVSVVTIYRHIYFEALHSQSQLYLHLRTRRRQRKPQYLLKKGVISQCHLAHPRNHSIELRSRLVERRARLGDYERDLIRGAEQSQGFVLTIVERASRLTRMAKLHHKQAQLTHEQTVQLLRGQPGPVRTITNDNGSEFSEHQQTAAALNAEIYFAHPYSSWERGTNENTNGLIRQYLPKRLDFTRIETEHLVLIEHRLNNRPRKCLGYQTPNEVFDALLRKSSVAIAS